MLLIRNLSLLIISASMLFILFRFKRIKAGGDFGILRKKYRNLSLMLLLVSFPLTAILGFLLSSLFIWLSSSGAKEAEIRYLILPDREMWYVLGFLLGLIASLCVIILFIKWKLQEEAEEFWKFYAGLYKHRYRHPTALLKYVSIATVIFCYLMAVVQFNHCVRLKETSIVINGFMDFRAREYAYTDIAEIIHFQKIVAPNGNIVDKPHYAIRFNDGYTWRTTDGLRSPKESDEEAVYYMVRRSGRNLYKVEIDTD